MKTFISDLSGKAFPASQKVNATSIREGLIRLIREDKPDFDRWHCLAIEELKAYKLKYIVKHLAGERGEIPQSAQTVLNSIEGDTILADAIEDASKKPLSFGQRLADKVADFGGSWTFIISFVSFLLLWIAINVFVLLKKEFDPYPFILLNLILSCVAALQAPVIMMSQNRKEEKDRERAKKDYMVNLKAELEIKSLHEKIDRVLALEHKIIEILEHNNDTQG